MASYVEPSEKSAPETITQDISSENPSGSNTAATSAPSSSSSKDSSGERKRKSLGYYFRLAMAKSRVINSIQRQRESKDSVEGDLGEVSRKTKKLSAKFNSSLKMPRGIKSDQEEARSGAVEESGK